MTDDAAKKLREWAHAHAVGEMRSPIAVGVLELLNLRECAISAYNSLDGVDGGGPEEGACAAKLALAMGLGK